jgi:hypothetical protein
VTPINLLPPGDDPEWREWHDAAREAMDRIKEKYKLGDEVVVDERLYKRAMPWLLRANNYKCAYCEAEICATQPGDVEHYRPKNRIKELDGKIVKILLNNGSSIDHPGYWWLSYDWLNLLPACIDCNRMRYHEESDVRTPAGKADFFPISGKRAVLYTDELPDEHALLLNPADPDFSAEAHFEFLANGKVEPKTPEAQTSCTVLGLNIRERLVAQRAAAYANVSALVTQFIAVSLPALISQAPLSPVEIDIRRRLNEMWARRTQYAAFVGLALQAARKNLASRNINIEFPLPLH